MANLKVPVTEDDHIQGNINAPTTLIVYGDFECPACGKVYSIIKKIQATLGDKLRYVFRNYPLTEIHPFAEMAAETAEFAGSYGQYWQMHDLIFQHQTQLGMALLFQLTEILELSVSDLQQAIKTNKFKEKIKHDFIGGVYSGVNGTPGIFINGESYVAPLEYENLLAAIQEKTLQTH